MPCSHINDGGETRLRLVHSGQEFSASIRQSDDARCAGGTTLVHVEAVTGADVTLKSNTVFLINLRDVETRRGQRRERRIREAQQTAAQFVAVLGELLQLNDTDPLQTFLTYCDIPIVNSARPYIFRASPPCWEGENTLRILGDRNLRTYASLHDAVIGFCDRHLSKLRRHCDHASISGVPNFMHIALAIGAVLRSQVDRALIGLETTSSPLSPEEWAQHRRRIEDYLLKFRELVNFFNSDYLPELERRFRASAIRDALQPDLQPLTELCTTFLKVRARVEACRKSTLRVKTMCGTVTPPIFEHDLLDARRWAAWSETVESAKNRNADWMQVTA